MKSSLLILLTLISFSVSSFNQASLQKINAQKIEELLNEYPITNGPGIAISIMKDGQNIYKNNRGYANLEHMIPITDSTKFEVGSISKQFTAFSILLLEEDGKLSIEDDISLYLTELEDLEYRISIKQLINHTSGFRNTTDLNYLIGKTEMDAITQEQMIDLLLRQKGLNFIPGTRFQYCNSGYVLLAEIIKRVSGMRFAEFAQERIFKPLNMKESLFLDDLTTLVKNKATSYSKQGEEYRNILLNRSIVGSTGLNTTTRDLCLWANNFNTITIGSKAIFQKMHQKGILNDGKVIPYALGQELKVYKGLDVVFHGGGDAGFRSYLLRVPAHKLDIVISGNFESFNPLNIPYGLVDAVLPNHIKEVVQKPSPIYTSDELKKFEGDYKIFPGLYISIWGEKDTLYFKEYDSDTRLALPVLGENEFVFPEFAHSKFKFFADSLNWHFSDFYYPGKKVVLDPPKYDSLDLNEFIGSYRSNEMETTYEVVVENNVLKVTHNFNQDAPLSPIEKDAFKSSAAHIGQLEFVRTNNEIVNGLTISGQSSYNVHFTKME